MTLKSYMEQHEDLRGVILYAMTKHPDTGAERRALLGFFLREDIPAGGFAEREVIEEMNREGRMQSLLIG